MSRVLFDPVVCNDCGLRVGWAPAGPDGFRKPMFRTRTDDSRFWCIPCFNLVDRPAGQIAPETAEETV